MIYRKSFIELAIKKQALLFGEFTLKSGRVSPYFFNMGKLNDSESLKIIGQCYAATIAEYFPDTDVIFGPAYKGIPIMAVTLASFTPLIVPPNKDKLFDVQYAYNRKEVKDHGEGGILVGADITNKNVVIVDDVITAGTAIRDTVSLLEKYNAKLIGVVVALDRQERGQGVLSAIQQVSEDYNVNVCPIFNRDDIVRYLQEDNRHKEAFAIQEYSVKYMPKYSGRNRD